MHRLLQVGLFLLFFGGLNFLAMRHFTRYDVTRNHLFSLSPETEAYIRDLQRPVTFIVTIPRDSAHAEEQILSTYVGSLLDQYAYYAREADVGDQLSVEYVDLDKDPTRAAELRRDYNVSERNVVLAVSEDRVRVIDPNDLLEFEELKPINFKGEQALTSALIEVSANDRARIYFTVGHGEMRLDDVSPQRGLSQLATQLQARNFEMGVLDLSQRDSVPDDADAVIIADPLGPFLASEQEILRRYLNDDAGRVVLFLAPGVEAGLDALLEDWGVRADDMLVLENDPASVEGTGSFLIRRFEQHPISEPLLKNQTVLVSGLLRPVRPDLTTVPDDRLRLTSLLGSSPQSWAESTYRNRNEPARYNASSDLPGPVTLGTVAERRSATQLGISLPGGRLVALGSGDLFANRRLGSSLGNQLFFISMMNWLLDRDQSLALPPRPIDKYQVALSQADLRRLGWLYLLVPGVVGLLGVLLLWIRKW
jgi:ABC-type uncharacterized transport system involved in gliding motility auxiliary subunit